MAQQHILQVSELTKKVRFILESEINTVWLCGEISNFVAASSGHWYLSLKDQKSQVRCAMFKGNNRRVRHKPANGQQVLVRAKVSLYEPRGDFQLIIEQMEPAGEGLLRQQYQQLKNKLHSEGLFDPQYKQQIPSIIKRIGIITSPTGAAVKDILSVLKRRNPLLQVVIYPAIVQGEQAKFDISQAIQLANERNEVDVLIIGRGGGSLEDLWAFNEELVARSIFKSHIPTISAVGHEIDTALSDYVADIRAATPSAAAELVSTDFEEITNTLKTLNQRLNHAIKQKLKLAKQQLSVTQHRLKQVNPEQQLQSKQQKCDQLELRLQQTINREMLRFKQQPQYLQQRLLQTSPAIQIAQKHTYSAQLEQRLTAAQQRLIKGKTERFASVCEQLNLVSPLATIARGYSVVRSNHGSIIKQIASVKTNELLNIEVSDGIISAKVTATIANEEI